MSRATAAIANYIQLPAQSPLVPYVLAGAGDLEGNSPSLRTMQVIAPYSSAPIRANEGEQIIAFAVLVYPGFTAGATRPLPPVSSSQPYVADYTCWYIVESSAVPRTGAQITFSGIGCQVPLPGNAGYAPDPSSPLSIYEQAPGACTSSIVVSTTNLLDIPATLKCPATAMPSAANTSAYAAASTGPLVTEVASFINDRQQTFINIPAQFVTPLPTDSPSE